MKTSRLVTSSIRAALVAVVAALLFSTPAHAQLRQRLLDRDEVGRMGLVRAWYSQIQLDRSRNQVERAVLNDDMLVVLTTAGLVQALDANTGQTLWSTAVGKPEYPSLGPAVSGQHVALVNGSTLYVLERNTGKPIKNRPVGGAPGASPALSETYVFVPLVNGRIEGYPLGESVLTPWYYQSYGRTMVPPTVSGSLLAWPTDRGYVYVADADDPAIRFRLETGSNFLAPAARSGSSVFAANMAGEVFAMDDSTGARRWKFGTGYPITRAPAIVANRVFVTNEKPSLVAIDAEHGTPLWEAYGVTQFAAASSKRVYGVDEVGALVVFDAASGAPLGRLTTAGSTRALVNDQTDRLFLVSDDGMVQCLHEIGATEPLRHGAAPPESSEGADAASPATEETPEPGTREPEALPPAEEPPAAEEPEAEADDASPFGTDDEDPFGFD